MAVSADLTGLAPDTTYYYEVVAANDGGTTERHDPQLHHGPEPEPRPVATTQAATAVSSTAATLNATVNPEGASTNVWFQYGTDPNAVRRHDDLRHSFHRRRDYAGPSRRAGGLLAPGTTYYYRVVASNAGGVADGAILSFTTAPTSTPTPTPTPTSTPTPTPTPSSTTKTSHSPHPHHKPHAAKPTHTHNPHVIRPTHHSQPHPRHPSHHHPRRPVPTPTPSPGTTPPGATGTGTSPAPASSYTVDISGNFIDGPFFGSLDETFTLDASAGSDLADAIASHLTDEYTAQAAQLSTQLKPGETMAPAPRTVRVYNVADNSGIVTGSFICQGGSGLTMYQYTGGFTAGVTT